MGGGGGDDVPDAPDYTEVINSIKSVMGWTQAQADKAMKYAEDAYAKYGATSDAYIKSAINSQGRLTEDAQKYREDVEKYRPVQQKQIDEALRLSNPAEWERQAGAQEQAAEQAVRARLAAAQEQAESRGVTPGTARSDAVARAAAIGGAGVMTAAGNAGRLAAQDQARKAVADAVAQGNVVSDNVNQAEGAGLAAGASGVQAGLQTEAQRNASMGSPDRWGALTAQGNDSWARALGDSYQNELGRYEAQQKAEEFEGQGWGKLFGLGTSLLTAPMTGGGSLLGNMFVAEGGAIPDPQMFAQGGGPIPVSASQSRGGITDDVPAVIRPSGVPPAPGPTAATKPAQLNAGEFVLPKDVMAWMGEKGAQQLILKARKEMQGGNGERPAVPTEGPPQPSYGGVGAIPEQAGVA